jgi:hypothetical protein
MEVAVVPAGYVHTSNDAIVASGIAAVLAIGVLTGIGLRLATPPAFV